LGSKAADKTPKTGRKHVNIVLKPFAAEGYACKVTTLASTRIVPNYRGSASSGGAVMFGQEKEPR
jgi:hypothetical protein